MSGELFGSILRTYVVGALLWVTGAFLMCGLMVFQQKVTGGPDGLRRAMVTNLFIWPLAVLFQLVAWLADLCWWVFNPERGPVALLAHMLSQAGRNLQPPRPTEPLRKAET